VLEKNITEKLQFNAKLKMTFSLWFT